MMGDGGLIIRDATIGFCTHGVSHLSGLEALSFESFLLSEN